MASRRAALFSARVAKAVLMAIPRGKPTKLSIDTDTAASQAFKASPLLKVCVGPSAAFGREGDAKQEAAVVAAAAENVRRSGIFKKAVPPPEKKLEGRQLEGWTLVGHQKQGELAA